MNILFISLGCDKNLVDTEVMLGMLASRGYQMVEERDTGRCDRDQYLLFCPRCQRGEYSEHSGRWQNIKKRAD